MTATASLRDLSDDVEAWLRVRAFRTGDDIPRIRRTPGWLPDFTPASIDERRAELSGLIDRLDAIHVDPDDVAAQIDARLLRSVLNRVRWDLDVLRNWERDAVFLVGQVLGPWFDLLLPRPPFSAEVEHGLVQIARSIPDRVDLARANLETAGVADLARVAAHDLQGMRDRFATSVEGLAGVVNDSTHSALRELAPAAGAALEDLGDWLRSAADALAPAAPVGRDRFVWFLRHVALVPDEPEDMVRAALQDYHRAVLAELVTRNRFRDVPADAVAATITEQVAREEHDEAQVRAFYEREGLLSQPTTLRRYHVAEMPPYLEPIQFLGVSDDLTDADRLDVDAVSYMPVPRPDLPYFYAANARDPRLGIIHEGAHYKQLALSWASQNPIRRRYVDSTANEGIAFYNEELMLLAGLFDDAPHSQEVVHNFNRLRCLRVVADVNLTTGAFSLDDAVDFFVRLVPMDVDTAREECAMYLATPGLAMSYHVGKQHFLRLVTDASVARGADFSLRDVHDHVWANGNVPFSLLRWELLGDRSDLDVLDAAATDLPADG